MNDTLLIYIFMMAGITYLTRFPMLFLSSRMNVPLWLQRSLKMVPIGVFSSMTIPLIVFYDQDGLWNAEYVIAGTAAFIIGMWKKQIFLSLIMGVFTVFIIRLIF